MEIRMFRRLFLTHPASVGETYFEHLRVALGFALAMLGGGLACAVHAVVPALFTRTGSRTIEVLHRRMIESRARAPREAGASGAVRSHLSGV
jgi:hypothetical protein